jgi:hypothetical protein
MIGIGQDIGAIQAQANPFEMLQPTPKISVGKGANAVLFVAGFELGLQRVGGLRPQIRRWILRPPGLLCRVVPRRLSLRQSLRQNLLRRARDGGQRKK